MLWRSLCSWAPASHSRTQFLFGNQLQYRFQRSVAQNLQFATAPLPRRLGEKKSPFSQQSWNIKEKKRRCSGSGSDFAPVQSGTGAPAFPPVILVVPFRGREELGTRSDVGRGLDQSWLGILTCCRKEGESEPGRGEACKGGKAKKMVWESWAEGEACLVPSADPWGRACAAFALGESLFGHFGGEVTGLKSAVLQHEPACSALLQEFRAGSLSQRAFFLLLPLSAPKGVGLFLLLLLLLLPAFTVPRY